MIQPMSLFWLLSKEGFTNSAVLAEYLENWTQDALRICDAWGEVSEHLFTVYVCMLMSPVSP